MTAIAFFVLRTGELKIEMTQRRAAPLWKHLRDDTVISVNSYYITFYELSSYC